MRGTDVTIPPDGEVLPAAVLQRIVAAAADADNPVFTGITRGSVAIGVTALGNSAASAYPITTQVVSFSSVPTGAGGVLPLLDQYGINYTGALVVIQNADPASTPLTLYPPPGASFGTGAVGAPVTVQEGISIAQCLSISNWVVVPLTGGSTNKISPQQILGNAGTVAAVASGVALSSNFTLTNANILDLVLAGADASAATVGGSPLSAILELNSGQVVGAAAAGTARPINIGQGLSLTQTGTATPQLAFAATGTPLDGATVGELSLSQAFLSLPNGGTIEGFVSSAGGHDFSRNIVLSGNCANLPAYESISGYSHVTGNIANNTAGGSYHHNLVLNDYVAALGAGGGTYGLIQFTQNVIGSTVTGGRVCGNFVLNVEGPTSNNGGEYVALSCYAIGSGGDLNGVLFPFNPVAQINSGSWAALVGAECDFGVAAGSTVQANYGWNIGILPQHAVNGTQDDICLMMDGNEGAATWEVGIGFGANLKPQGFGSNSTLIKLFKDVITGTVTIANGIDLTAGGHGTITGNAIITPGFTVSGAGSVSLAAVTVGTRDATITAQCTLVPADAGGNVVVNTSSTAAQSFTLAAVTDGFACNVWDGSGAASSTQPLSIHGTFANGGTVVLVESAYDGITLFYKDSKWRYK